VLDCAVSVALVAAGVADVDVAIVDGVLDAEVVLTLAGRYALTEDGGMAYTLNEERFFGANCFHFRPSQVMPI
jgi:hypothetical protein